MNRRIVHRPLGRSIGTLLLVVASALEPVAEQRPTFKSEAELVAINVVVTDQHGRTVTGLNEDAFQVSEDHQPQRLTLFTRDPLPLSIAVALDTSASMRGDRFQYARQAIWRLVDLLEPKDEIAVVGFNNWPYQITPWTSDHKAVVMALSDQQPMAAGGFTALFDALHAGLNLLDTAAARRRALLVISDGNEELPGDQWLRGGMSGHTFLRRLNVSAQDRLPKYIEAVRRSEGLVYAVGISDSRGEPLDEKTLKALVDPTGGFVTTVDANADVPSAVERVLNDLRAQYLIGFTPTHPPDGKFHKLQVTVRGCDCHARARAGFVHTR
jgi:Ca-activated chloride channel family protein